MPALNVINIIVANGPTAESEEEEIDRFYTELDIVFTRCKCSEITFVLSDLNAKVSLKKQVMQFDHLTKNKAIIAMSVQSTGVKKRP